MPFRLGNTTGNNVRQKSNDAIVDAVDAGSGAGTIKIYTGAQPATPSTAPSGTLLFTGSFPDPAFGASDANGSAALTSSIAGTAAASGTAGWFRVADSDGNAMWDGDITGTGGGGVMEFDNTAFVATGTVTISGFTVSTPMEGA